MIFDTSIAELLVRVPVVLFALTIHEFMHGWTAYRCGDDTAQQAGRLTLNPLAHLDLVGTIALMIAPIGWAKPVPVNPANFGRPRRDNILVSVAGVAANFGVAAAAGLLARVLALFGLGVRSMPGGVLWSMLGWAIFLNFGLFVFNLLPIPPLDGSHVLEELLPWRLRDSYRSLRRYGVVLLLIVVLGSNFLAGRLGFNPLFLPVYLLARLFAGDAAIDEVFRGFAVLAGGNI